MITRFRVWEKATIIITLGGVLSTAYVVDVKSGQEAINSSFYFLKRGMSSYKNGQINQALSRYSRYGKYWCALEALLYLCEG
ncbi:hypothetical protein HNQ69_001530 [Bartonella callosciuri]|uniref:Uncharacterized protein n=1 Tax=Bartonella callosciuri TaxID=686223 RepID=A0A840NRC2_9HYPH|nr:hypothetical protein [Bartonella callosciuri]